MEYAQKQILTSGGDSKCLGEIWRLQSPQLLVWSVLSVNTLNICKDAYGSFRRYMDMVAHVDSSDYIYRVVDV